MSVTVVLTYHEGRRGAPYLKLTTWGQPAGGRYGSLDVMVLPAEESQVPEDLEELATLLLQAVQTTVYGR